MKKIISIILALVISSVFSFTSVAISADEEITLEEYSSQLSDLTQKYDINSIGGINDDTELTEVFLNRILVKTLDNQVLEEDCGAIEKIEGYNGFHILQYTNQESTKKAYEYYSSLSNVDYVEYDFCYRILEPETEYVEYEYNKNYLSWGSTTVNTSEAISYANYILNTAPEIEVAVIDTGINTTHSIFNGRISKNKFDYIDNDSNPDDGNSHGTHVAGIIADNSAENVKLSAYRTIDNEGNGYYFITCDAIDRAVEYGADVINISLGWGIEQKIYNKFENSIANAVNNGVSVVVAACNYSKDASLYCPASNNNVVTVAATTFYNTPWSNSNYGECVDIAAPGELINSSVPGGSEEMKSGTSMATPFVSAAAAFLKTLNPNYTPDKIKEIIKESVFVPENWDYKYGTGILDFSKIVSKCISHHPKITLDENKKAVIYSENENVVVYYTTDNTTPVVGVSNIYTEPIDISEAISIKAIVCETGKFPSVVSTLKINWSEDITIRYKGTVSMLLPPNREIIYCIPKNIGIATPDEASQTIYGRSVGDTKIAVYLDSGQKITYNVTVEYESWQLFIIYFLFGWLWYI